MEDDMHTINTTTCVYPYTITLPVPNHLHYCLRPTTQIRPTWKIAVRV